MAKSLLTGEPLFGYPDFTVRKQPKRILYLGPEVARGSALKRAKAFGLLPFVKNEKLFIHDMQVTDGCPKLNDPRILKAAEGAVVMLDTAVRFTEGDENTSEASREFGKQQFALIRAGARGIVGAHHSPKDLTRSTISLEKVMRGSGDIAATLSGGWGIWREDEETTLLSFHNVKMRDFKPVRPFAVIGTKDGSDNITGLAMTNQVVGASRAAKDAEWDAVLDEASKLRKQGMTQKDIAKALGVSEYKLCRAGIGKVEAEDEDISFDEIAAVASGAAGVQ